MPLISTIASPTTTSINPTFGNHSWILPDGSLVVAYDAGTDTTFGGSGAFQQCILVQSTNWSTTTPTWTFVRQITSTANQRVCIWWDAPNNKLHCIAGGSTSAGGPLEYIGGTYTSGTWSWGSLATVVSANVAFPAICVDTGGIPFVVYRYNSGGLGTYTVYATAKISGTWQTPFQISAGSSTSTDVFGTFTASGSNVLCVTYENTQCYASVHPDGTNYQTGWGTATVSDKLTNFTGQGALQGPVGVYADSSTSCWVSASSNSGTANVGLFVERFTFSGTTVTWQTSSFVNLDTSGSGSTSAASGSWSSANGRYYLVYNRVTASNTSDIYFFSYNTSNSTWSSSAFNLTGAGASNNILPVVPFSGVTTVLPIVYQSGVATLTLSILKYPFSNVDVPQRLNLAVGNDIVQRMRLLFTRTRNMPLRLRLIQNTDLTLRFRSARFRYITQRLQLAIFKDIGQRLKLHLLYTKDLAQRLVLKSQPRNRNLWLRLVLNATSTTDDFSLRVLLSQLVSNMNIGQRIRVISALTRNDIVLRFILSLQHLTQRDIRSRCRLSASNKQDIVMRLLFGSPPAPATSLSGRLAGVNVVPLLKPPFLLYAINGTILDTQPSICTAPGYEAQYVIGAGSTFLLTFLNPSANTLSLLTSGSINTSSYVIRAFGSTLLLSIPSNLGAPVIMTFAALDGQPATGLVTLNVNQNSGIVQVLCTTVGTIVQQKARILTQFW